jgi:outer membrane protein TolC
MFYAVSFMTHNEMKYKIKPRVCSLRRALILTTLLSASGCCFAQVISQQPSSPNLSSNEGAAAPPDAAPTHNATQVVTQSAPQTITLQDAIARAQRIYGPYIAATTDAQVAREDFRQARNAMLPSIGYTQQYLGTQGNGKTPNGRYVTNDGVHVYRAWGVFHEDFPAGFFSAASYKRADALAAVANAKAEIARRGLVVTVTKAFYTLIADERKYASAQQTVSQAQRFLDDNEKTRDRRRGGPCRRRESRASA